MDQPVSKGRRVWQGIAVVGVAALIVAGAYAELFHAEHASSASDAAGPPPATSPTPVQVAQQWFHAIDSKNVPEVLALMAGGGTSSQGSAWRQRPPSQWPSFTDLRCAPEHPPSAGTYVRCTFNESASPSEGNPDTFWSLTMVRSKTGAWLISNYGQP